MGLGDLFVEGVWVVKYNLCVLISLATCLNLGFIMVSWRVRMWREFSFGDVLSKSSLLDSYLRLLIWAISFLVMGSIALPRETWQWFDKSVISFSFSIFLFLIYSW